MGDLTDVLIERSVSKIAFNMQNDRIRLKNRNCEYIRGYAHIHEPRTYTHAHSISLLEIMNVLNALCLWCVCVYFLITYSAAIDIYIYILGTRVIIHMKRNFTSRILCSTHSLMWHFNELPNHSHYEYWWRCACVCVKNNECLCSTFARALDCLIAKIAKKSVAIAAVSHCTQSTYVCINGKE